MNPLAIYNDWKGTLCVLTVFMARLLAQITQYLKGSFNQSLKECLLEEGPQSSIQALHM